MLQRIALLAIAAPRRIIAIAAARDGGLRHLRHPRRQEPVRRRLPGPDVGVGPGHPAARRQVRPGRHAAADQRDRPTAARRAPRRAPSAPTSPTQLKASPHVAQVTSAWTAPPPAAPALISKDGKTGLIVAGITGGESDAQKHAKELTDRLVHDRDGVTVRAGGEAMIYVQINGQSEKDLLLMESIAIPLSFIVLVWVFGGLLAAALPLAVGGFAILGSMAVLRAITLHHRRVDLRAEPDRRDGPGAGHRLHAADHQPIPRRTRRRRRPRRGADPHHGDRGPDRAVLGDDGRAVDGRDGAVPDVLPEVVRLRGHRGGGVRGRRGDRGGARGDRAARRPAGLAGCAPAGCGGFSGRPEPVPKPIEQIFWYRSTKFVMRRAIPIGVAIVALLLVLGAPFLGVKWGFPDDRVLPQSLSARQVGDELRNDFAVDSATQRHRRHPGRQRRHARRPRPLRRGAVPGARRVVGVGARRHVRRRQARRAAVGGHRIRRTAARS